MYKDQVISGLSSVIFKMLTEHADFKLTNIKKAVDKAVLEAKCNYKEALDKKVKENEIEIENYLKKV